MKKRKPRKFIKGTKEFNRRKTTQMFQKKAREEGTTFSPRRLSRSVGLFVGQVTDEISAKNAARNWKAYIEGVIKHPREFRAMMNPVKDIRDSSGRVIRKVEG